MATTMLEKVGKVLQDCQANTFTKHRQTKSSNQLRKLYDADAPAFTEALFAHVHRLLPVLKREPAVEQLIKLVVGFVTTASAESEANEFASVFGGADDVEAGLDLQLIEHLLAFTGAADKAVRFRACQIIALTVTTLGEDTEMTDELWGGLVAHMVTCARDKVATVREQAVRVFERLLDVNDAEDEVLVECVRILRSDASAPVRKAVLGILGVTKHTLAAVMDACRDVDPSIRKVRAAVYACVLWALVWG